MKIEIKLGDSRYCDGCPCLLRDTEEPTTCGLDYPDKDGYLEFREVGPSVFRYLRPQKCIDEHGE